MIALYIFLGLIALTIILLAVAALRTAFLAPKTSEYTYSTDQRRIDEYTSKLATMIQHETVSKVGDEQNPKFTAFHDVMRSLYPKVFENCEYINIDGCLIMHWRGSDSSLQPIVLMSHIDVVAAEGEWKFPPFSGTVSDGKIWGRGSGDTKCSVMAFYQAAEEMIGEGYTPACDVYLVSGCTEEIGGEGGPKICRYFKERGIRLYMLCDEGGGMILDPISGVKGTFAAVGIFEKGYGDVQFIARSSGGHASAPAKNTPIARLAKFITEVETKSPFRAEFSPAVEGMFTTLAPYCNNFGLKMVMANLWLFKPIVKGILPSISPQAAAMLKTTIAFTMQSGSDGYNVLPQEAIVCANMRYIPHQKADESIEAVAKIAAKYDIETKIIKKNDPSASLDLSGRPFEITSQAINKVFPGVGIMPYVVTGATDARFYGDVCNACVRFSPVVYGPEQMAGMHGLNENIEIAVLPGAVDYYKEIIKAQETRM